MRCSARQTPAIPLRKVALPQTIHSLLVISLPFLFLSINLWFCTALQSSSLFGIWDDAQFMNKANKSFKIYSVEFCSLTDLVAVMGSKGNFWRLQELRRNTDVDWWFHQPFSICVESQSPVPICWGLLGSVLSPAPTSTLGLAGVAHKAFYWPDCNNISLVTPGMLMCTWSKGYSR